MATDRSKISPVKLVDADGEDITTGGVATASSDDVHTPAINTAAIITYTAVAAAKHVIRGVAWSYDAAPTGGNLLIEDVSGTTVFSLDITAAGPGFIPLTKKGAAINTAMIITLSAGGGGVTGKVNVLEHWTEV